MLACGQALFEPENEFIIRFNGNGTEQRAIEAIIGLYEQSGDASKLQDAKTLQIRITRARSAFLQSQ